MSDAITPTPVDLNDLVQPGHNLLINRRTDGSWGISLNGSNPRYRHQADSRDRVDAGGCAHESGAETIMSREPTRPTKCPTCPFRPGSPYAHLADSLAESAMTKVSRICHSTGSNNAINRRTGKKPMICRGARDLQLLKFTAMGFIDSPTDAAWAKKCREMNLPG